MTSVRDTPNSVSVTGTAISVSVDDPIGVATVGTQGPPGPPTVTAGAMTGTDGEIIEFVGTTPTVSPHRAHTVVTVAATDTPAWQKRTADYVCNGSNDDVEIQAAIDSITEGLVHLLPGSFTTSAVVTLPFTVALTGSGKSSTFVTQTDDAAYCFDAFGTIAGPPEYVQFRVADMTINATYGIQVNLPNTDGDFGNQAIPIGASIERVTFTGTYRSGGNTDPDEDSDTVPTLAELEAFGVGVRWGYVHNSIIKDCQFTAYGVGILFDGCDLCTAQNIRYQSCARAAHSRHDDTTGSGHQNRFLQSDLLVCFRVGYIGIEGQDGDIVSHCHFENTGVYGAGTYILTENDWGTQIVHNKFEGTNVASPKMLAFAPRYGLLVKDNTYTSNATASETEVLATNFNIGLWPLATFIDNFTMPLPPNAGVRVAPLDPYRFDAYNFASYTGYTNWAFETSAFSGREVVTTAVGPITTTLAAKRGVMQYRICVTGRKVTTAGFMVINYVGNVTTALFSSFAGFSSTSLVEVILIDVTLPGGEDGSGYFEIIAVTTDFELESLEVVPMLLVPASPPAYTITNHTNDRALNETGDTLVQVANVLGTLINDLKESGYIV